MKNVGCTRQLSRDPSLRTPDLKLGCPATGWDLSIPGFVTPSTDRQKRRALGAPIECKVKATLFGLLL